MMDGKTAQKIEAVGKFLLLMAAAALLAIAWPPLLPDTGADAAARANTHTAQTVAHGATGRTERDYTTVWPEGVDLHSLSPESLTTYDRATMARVYAQAEGKAVVVGVLVETDGGKAETAKEPRYVLTDGERRMLTIVAVNADFTDEDSMMGIIRVVYNRVHDSRFPDTVAAVLTAPRQFERSDRVNGYAKSAYNEDRIGGLVDRVFRDNEDVFDGANVVYYSHHRVQPHRIARGLVFVARYGETAFYKQD